MNNLLKTIQKYWTDAPFTNVLFWVCIIGTVLLIFTLSFVIRKMLWKNSNQKLQTTFLVYKSRIFSSYIVAGVVVLWACICWVSNYYVTTDLRLCHILMLFISLLIPVLSGLSLRGHYNSSNSFQNISTTSITLSDYEENKKIAKKEFQKLKRFGLIGLLGFIGLVAVGFRTKTLISIIIDDSGSMGPALEIGRNALGRTLAKNDDTYTKFIVTSFGDGNPSPSSPYANFSGLMAVTAPNLIDAKTINCQSVSEALSYINTLQPLKQYGLNQAVWQNYLISNQESSAGYYDNKLLLIITDGIEYHKGWYDKAFCDESVPLMDLYGNNVYLIDLFDRSRQLPGEVNGFYEMMQSCFPENIYSGLSLEDYSFAIDKVIGTYILDPTFIYFIGIMYVLMYTIFLLINPKS